MSAGYSLLTTLISIWLPGLQHFPPQTNHCVEARVNCLRDISNHIVFLLKPSHGFPQSLRWEKSLVTRCASTPTIFPPPLSLQPCLAAFPNSHFSFQQHLLALVPLKHHASTFGLKSYTSNCFLAQTRLLLSWGLRYFIWLWRQRIERYLQF